MRVHQLLYQDPAHLLSWIDMNDIQDSKRLLIQVYTSIVQLDPIHRLIGLLHTRLPQATCIGCASEGQILDGEMCESGTVLSFIEFEQAALDSVLFPFIADRDCYDNGKMLAARLTGADTQAMIIFTSTLANSEDFVQGVESIAPHVVLAGGISLNQQGQTVLFTKDGVMEQGAVGVALSGENLQVHNQYSLNWKSVGKRLVVTRAEGNRIYAIDGMPVVDLYRKYLGEKIATQITTKSTQFPLILSRNGIDICRDVLAVHEDGSVTVSGHLYEGEVVRFGFGDPELIVEGSKQLIETLRDITAEAILIYSCTARKSFMFNSIGYELSPLQQIGPNIGFFTSGEFYHHERRNMVINHSMTLLVLSENTQMPKPEAVRLVQEQEETQDPWGELDALRAMSHMAQVSTDELIKLNVSLEASEQRYSSLVQYNPEIVYSIDAKGTFLSLNPVFYDLLGYQSDEVQSLYEVVNPGDHHRLRSVIERAFHGRPQSFELTLLMKGQIAIPFMVTKIPIIVNEEIVGVYGIAQNMSERKKAEARITFMAYHDVLTELPNRTLLYRHLDELLISRNDSQAVFSILFVDLDNFKEINDSFGHFVGDDILKRFASKLKALIQNKGIAARFGGDEFVVILEMEQMTDIKDVAEQIVAYFTEPLILEGTEQFITTSVGISLFPQDGDSSEALLKNADLAMYKAKQSGKNRFLFYESEQSEELREKRLLGSELRKAIMEDELQLNYQPIVDLRSDKVIGCEALVRWHHKERGPIPPSLFIPIAEEYGLIDMLGTWVLQTACLQMVRWHVDHGALQFISVNVSYQQFQRFDFVDVVSQVLQETGLDPARLHLEITESTALINLGQTRLILHRLQQLGISISMDDFGTGFSSLSCIKDLSIDKLKIDRSFITNISTDQRDAAIVKTIIALSRNLNMKVLAEGVESSEQLEKLAEYDCDEIQGFLFSRPIPAEEFEALFLAAASPGATAEARIVP
ncbi:bifunctional diguanylate cyclase/phosphodiesterase [Paenibacillus aestuarii]|uniref:EAL domain-containing protein n=1 Tax=Paenibacillus aestuarii TaxID=516965 RepID=A0ABW0K9D9_9BACL|nr:EAL domain-containing protein [Paenibacillus aestuarii]